MRVYGFTRVETVYACAYPRTVGQQGLQDWLILPVSCLRVVVNLFVILLHDPFFACARFVGDSYVSRST